MFCYRAFGLRIRSDLELPELSPDVIGDNWDVRLVAREQPPGEVADRSSFQFSRERQVLNYAGHCEFVINGADEVVVTPDPNGLPGMLAFPLLGPVFGLLLHLRGHFVLHGSAVSLDGAGVGFLGDKGAGKSTLAAALLQLPTTRLLTDDLLAFDERGDILAAFPQIKLAPDALVMAEKLDGALRPPPTEDFPKQQVRLRSQATGAVAPRALFELRRAAEPRIEPLAPSEALRTMIRYSYISRFVTRPLEPEEQRRLFMQAAQIVRHAQVARLYVPDTLERLPDMGEWLMARI